VGTVPSGEQWTIKSAGYEAVAVEVGGGLRVFRSAGEDLLDSYRETEVSPGSAGQVLAPWPNRIRDGRYDFDGRSYELALTEPYRHNAIHGLVNWARWRAVEVDAESVTLAYELPPQPGYPWALQLRTTYALGETGLRAEHEVTNLADVDVPFGFGTHPYLQIPGVAVDDLILHLPARSHVLVDGRLLPIGAAKVAGGEYDFTAPRRLAKTVLDTGFGDLVREPDGGSAVTLSAPDGRGVRIWADAAFGWWQVFTGNGLVGERFRRSVAIEPMTCPPDAFRSGRDLIRLAPGQTWAAAWGVTPLRPA